MPFRYLFVIHFNFYLYSMDLFDILQKQVSGQVLDQLSQQIGAPKQQTKAATDGIMAAILGGLANNASDSNGLQGLMGALDKDHDGSILDDLVGMVGQVGSSQMGNAPRAMNGAGILRHVLGNKQENAAQQISKSSGLNMSQIMKLMPIIAPVVMGVLGKQKRGGGFNMGDLAGILLSGASRGAQSSGMGGVLGQVLGGVLAQQVSKPGGGLFGKILGGLFGRR